MLSKSISLETINHSFELPSFISYAKDKEVKTAANKEAKNSSINTNKNKINIYASTNQTHQIPQTYLPMSDYQYPHIGNYGYFSSFYNQKHFGNDIFMQNQLVYQHPFPVIYPTNYNINNHYYNKEINENIVKLLSIENFKEMKSFLSSKKTFNFFTSQIDKLNPNDIEAIFSKLFQDIEHYMKDADLNTIIQKLILKLNAKQRMFFLDKIKDNLSSLACTYYSTYCIQSFIESSHSEQEQRSILNSIEDSLFKISTNKQGIHVMTLIFKFFNKIKFLKKFVLANILSISRTKYGIKFVKNLIDLIKDKKSSFKLLVIKEIESNILEFATNEYSHFLILHLFDSLESYELMNIVKIIYNEKDKLNNKFFKRILSFIEQAKLHEEN